MTICLRSFERRQEHVQTGTDHELEAAETDHKSTRTRLLDALELTLQQPCGCQIQFAVEPQLHGVCVLITIDHQLPGDHALTHDVRPRQRL